MQTLEIFQSLWAMSLLRPDRYEWTIDEQIEMIVKAGFDGVDLVYGDFDPEKLQRLLTQYNLACSVTAFPDSIEALRPAIETAQSLDARHLNIIGKVYTFSVSEGAKFVRGWIALCDKAGLPVTIETHRDCITTDLHYTLQLMEKVPEMRLCADLSHYVVSREFSWPITPKVQSQVESILDRSVAFQGRVASREQIQLQVSFEHHREWFDLFAGWWQYGFASWQKRAGKNACLNFLCELGPKEYAMTGHDGYELSDRWQESIIIRDRVRGIWDRL